MYFQAQMVRRVKAYLNSMKVISDETKLNEMSLQCEPAACKSINILYKKQLSGSFGICATQASFGMATNKDLLLPYMLIYKKHCAHPIPRGLHRS